MRDFKFVDGKRYRLVYARRIRKNGKLIYPKNAKAFKFWVED